MLAISSDVRDSPRSHARSAKRAAWPASYAALSAVVLALVSFGFSLYVIVLATPTGTEAMQADIADLQQDSATLRSQLLLQREELATYQLTLDELRVLSRQSA